MRLLFLGAGLLCIGANALAQPSAKSKSATVDAKEYNEAVRVFRSGLKPKIIGGVPAAEGAHPWQVSLQVSWIADPGAAHFCGGSIYKANWIITAAHCVTGLAADDLKISAGTNHLIGFATTRNVKNIVTHPQYDKATQDNDIALVELKDPLVMSDRIKPIEPVTNDSTFDGTLPTFTVTGWGATEMGGNTVRDLRQVGVQFVSRAECNKPLSYGGAITDNMLCAGPRNGGQDSCQGDSGGPLVVGDRGASQLAGIVSWGEGCAVALKFGVYTRVARYSDWLRANSAR
jgi:secreted trypsin-like serine protease